MNKRVIIESPLSIKNGRTIEENLVYARACMKHSLDQGEAPYASHLLYPQVYDDNDPDQRLVGLHAGFAWSICADLIAVYTDFGISSGMHEGIKVHKQNNIPIEYRSLGL